MSSASCPAPAADPRRRSDRAQPRHHGLAALAALRREQEMPYGLRSFLGDLYSAGAAVDFAVLYPGGQPGRRAAAQLDPRPAHARPATRSRPTARAGRRWRCIRCSAPHVRLPENPERHVWQADVGTDIHEWLARSPDPQCGRPAGCRVLRNGTRGGRTAVRRALRGLRCDLRADAAARPRPRCRRSQGRPGRMPPGSGSRPSRKVNTFGVPRRCSMPAKRPTSPSLMTSRRFSAAPEQGGGRRAARLVRRRGVQYGPAFAGLGRRTRPRVRARGAGRGRAAPRPRARSRAPTGCTRHCSTRASSPLRPPRPCRPTTGRPHAAAGCPRIRVSARPATRTTATPGSRTSAPRASRLTSMFWTSTATCY